MKKLIKLHDLGEGLNEAKVIEWQVKLGDFVKEGDIIVLLETAKSIVELPAPFNGRIKELLCLEGAMVQIGSSLCRMELDEPPIHQTAPLVGQSENDIIEIPSEASMKAIKSKTKSNANNFVKPNQTIIPTTIFDYVYVPNDFKKKITYQFSKLLSKTLKTHSKMNGHYDEENKIITPNSDVDLGIAMETDHLGIFVPTIRNPEHLSFEEFNKILSDLKEKRMNSKHYQHSVTPSFTLSNIGSINGYWGTPILIPPTIAIIAIGRMTTQPYWDGQSFQPRSYLPVSLTFDYRCISGQLACQFVHSLQFES